MARGYDERGLERADVEHLPETLQVLRGDRLEHAHVLPMQALEVVRRQDASRCSASICCLVGKG